MRALFAALCDHAWNAGRIGQSTPWFAWPGSTFRDQYEDGASDRAYITGRTA